MKPTFKNLEYYLNGAGVIRIQKVNGLSKENITIQDQYRERQLIIDLGQQYQDHLGYGIFPIDDEKVNQIEITNQGTTKLVVKQNTIQAYNLREDDNYIYIELVKPTEKYRKIIVLDPGHGGTDPGAVAFGIRESDLNLKEALRVQQLLQQNTDIKVYMTREADTTLTLAFRTDLANEIGADAFISFHNNAAGPNISGTEVYYFGTSTIGKQMAQMVQTNILTALGSVDRKIKDGSGLYVIRTSKMPAILIEAGFVTNYEEVMKLNSDSYNEKIAKGIYDAIVKMFDTLSFR
jgi:N-acetylmuramoyl-L-alanine amidase